MAPRRIRRETAIVTTVIVSIAALLVSPFAMHWLRDPVVARAERLPLSFPHSKHTGTGCSHCHHNMKEKTAGLPCVHCHKSDDPKLIRGIEGEFHDFCKGCHASLARSFEKHGPIESCVGCHVENNKDGWLP